ncbi:MAG: hypothetical protein ACOH2H_08235 [Cypionkella sp.]
MRIVRFLAGLLVGLAFIPAAASAKTTVPADLEVYNCNQTGGSSNLMSGRIFIIRHKATNEIEVYDRVIDFVYKKPIAAKVKGDTSSRLDLGWRVEHVPLQRSRTGTAIYNLTFIKATHSYNEGVVLAGFDNNENSSGACTLEH